jgi:hypothetical protein
MAFRRPFTALCAWLLLAGSALAADKPLTLEEVVAKARAALTDDVASLDKVRSLRLEFSSVDEQGKSPSAMTLTLAAPGLRHQRSLDEAAAAETVICAGRLEGWTTRRKDPVSRRELRVVTYAELRKLQDMARDDLAFFAAPAAGGSAEYKGRTQVDGRDVHAVHYAYASGFRITRHFDAKTFALVASDQLTPARELIRQTVVATTKVDGITFVSKETLHVEGRKSGEVTYGRIQVNPAVPADLFAFPSL